MCYDFLLIILTFVKLNICNTVRSFFQEMAVQQFCLRWNNHQPNFISVFTNLLSNESLVDVTLAAEGKQLQAHKVVLSACSTYFQVSKPINSVDKDNSWVDLVPLS